VLAEPLFPSELRSRTCRSGALAATLVGIAEYYTLGPSTLHTGFQDGGPGFEVLFGALTVMRQLQLPSDAPEFSTGRPITYRGNERAAGRLFLHVAIFISLISTRPDHPRRCSIYAMVVLSFVFRLLCGDADLGATCRLHVVISLMIPMPGLASSPSGFASEHVLIMPGAGRKPPASSLSVIHEQAIEPPSATCSSAAFGARGTASTKYGGRADRSGPISVETGDPAGVRIARHRRPRIRHGRCSGHSRCSLAADLVRE